MLYSNAAVISDVGRDWRGTGRVVESRVRYETDIDTNASSIREKFRRRNGQRGRITIRIFPPNDEYGVKLARVSGELSAFRLVSHFE